MASKLPPSTPRPKPSVAKSTSLQSGGKAPPVRKCLNVDSTPGLLPERRHSRPSHPMERNFKANIGKFTEGQDGHKKMKEQVALIERSQSNTMRDLPGPKKHFEESKFKIHELNGTCKHDKAHAVNAEMTNSLENEGCKVELNVMKQRYESALLEVQFSKQAMESLKHELMVCVEAKDEAVRLAGEAMSAAESTARRVKKLSAELTAAKGSTLLVGEHMTVGVDDFIGALPETLECSLLETEAPLYSPAQECSILEEHKKRYPRDTAESDPGDRKTSHVQNGMGQEMKYNGLVCPLEGLQEFGAAKEVKETAKNKIFNMRASTERVQAEAENPKATESITPASFVRFYKQLEEAEEKVARSSMENVVLVASLEYFKAESEKSQQIVVEALDREATASRNEATELLACMEKMRELNQAELQMWEDKEASACAMVQSLQTDLERHKSEAAFAAEKEHVSAAKVCDLIEELERCRTKLIEQQKQSSFEMAALSAKLKINQAELVKLEEMESSSADRAASLLFEMQTKEAEANDLKCRLSELGLKADAMNAQLLHLKEENVQLADLCVKEHEASARVTALNNEVLGLKQALEEALDAGNAVRNELSKLEVAFQGAIMERNKARGELEAVYDQVEQSKRIAAGRTEDKTPLEEAHSVEGEKCEAAYMDVVVVNIEVQKTKTDAQVAKEDADSLKSALVVERERAIAFDVEAKELRSELVKLRSELVRVQADTMEAVAARNQDECRLPLDMIDTDSMRAEAEMHTKHTLQEEISSLKEKLSFCEEQLLLLKNEADESQTCNLELVRELETAKAEKEASKRAVVDAHQLLTDMEIAKRLMEADIQRLLDDSKLWKSSKDARDILALSEIKGVGTNGYVLVADSRDEKPQPDSPDRESVQYKDPIYLHLKGGQKVEVETDVETVVEQEEIEVPVEEAAMRGGKKKKNALLHRLHSYLDKKKTVHVP